MSRDTSRQYALMIALAFATVAFAAVALSPGRAAGQQTPSQQRGQVFVLENCALCHATGKFGESPLPIAPRFRDLHLRYPVEHLEEALAEGIVTGHPTMPQFQLPPDQIADVIAYLKWLE